MEKTKNVVLKIAGHSGKGAGMRGKISNLLGYLLLTAWIVFMFKRCGLV